MKYEHIASLESFLDRAESRLLSVDARVTIAYPASFVSPWNADALTDENEGVLSRFSGSASVYAIFTASAGSSESNLRYIGKTTRHLARGRIRNHLITKNEKTGAKLEEIRRHVISGGSVEISWITIEPESLRGYVEEELIQRHREADWNRENKNGRLPPARRAQFPPRN